MRSRASACALLLVAVVVAMTPPGAEACSIVIGYETAFESERVVRSLQAPGFQFRYWHDDRQPFGMELTDAEGRTIASTIESSRLPHRPHYGMAQTYSVLVPARPLRPGRYTLRVGKGMFSAELYWWSLYTIEVGRDQPVPAAPESPREMAAAVAERQCMVNTHPDCRPIMALCVFLDLAFSAPHADDEPLIELSWAPIADGRPDAARRRTANGILPFEVKDGRRTLSIPGWWFEGIKPTDSDLWFEVRRVGRTGKRSPAASLTVPNASLLATARR